MSAIAVVVTGAIANIADADRFQAVLLAHRDRCLRDEPGTLQFDVLRPEGTEGKFIIYEVFADEAALKAHSEGASKKQGQSEAEGIEYEAVSTKCFRLA